MREDIIDMLKEKNFPFSRIFLEDFIPKIIFKKELMIFFLMRSSCKSRVFERKFSNIKIEDQGDTPRFGTVFLFLFMDLRHEVG